MIAGRGFGKTRTGAEWVRSLVESGGARRVALVGATAADARDVMIEGESGLLAVCPPWDKPHYEPSKRRLTWPNSATATAYSADEPERLRGPQHDAAWCDEVGSWRRPAAYDNLMLGLRIGADPRVCVTTTPRPTKLVQTLLGSGTTARTGGSSYDNRANLAPQFFEQIVARYEGTRLGRQEIHAEYLEITEGAWFTTFDPARNVTADAEYDPRFPARCAVDCGVSRHTGAVFYQVRESGPYRWKINVFADYHAVDLMSDVNAAAVREVAAGRCGGSLERVRLDPAATARTGVGPAAYGEYERVFGPRVLGYWPQHPVADGLDQVEILLGSESRDADLTIHPRCTHLIAAFNGYSREYRGGEWMAWPDPLQHPHEDLMDALRGGVRDAMPEGRKPQPKFTWRPGRSIL